MFALSGQIARLTWLLGNYSPIAICPDVSHQKAPLSQQNNGLILSNFYVHFAKATRCFAALVAREERKREEIFMSAGESRAQL